MTHSGLQPIALHHQWTAARIFMLVSVLYHVPLGVAGLLVDQTFPIGAAATRQADSAYIFSIFETNGWHSVAGLAIGLVSLYFLVRPRRAREGALAIGLGHIGIFLGLLLQPPSTFWLASNAADQVIHAFTAVAGTAAGLARR